MLLSKKIYTMHYFQMQYAFSRNNYISYLDSLFAYLNRHSAIYWK